MILTAIEVYLDVDAGAGPPASIVFLAEAE
jgi:hypothetical protein